MTIERHKQMAKELIAIRQRLIKETLVVGNLPSLECVEELCGVVHNMDAIKFRLKMMEKYKQVIHSVDKTRGQLEDIMYREHPKEATVDVYYPKEVKY